MHPLIQSRAAQQVPIDTARGRGATGLYRSRFLPPPLLAAAAAAAAGSTATAVALAVAAVTAAAAVVLQSISFLFFW